MKSPYIQSLRLCRVCFKKEAFQAGWHLPARPASVLTAPIQRPDPGLETIMLQIEANLAPELHEHPWGTRPGHPAKRLAEQLRFYLNIDISPDYTGLELIDQLLVDHATHTFRWLPPATFLAICDFIGVVLQKNSPEKQVGWAIPNNSDLALPILRIRGTQENTTLPIASRLVDWLIMPQTHDLPLTERLSKALRHEPPVRTS